MVRASLMDARIEGVPLLPGPVSLYASTRSLYAGARRGCRSTGTVAGSRIRATAGCGPGRCRGSSGCSSLPCPGQLAVGCGSNGRQASWLHRSAGLPNDVEHIRQFAEAGSEYPGVDSNVRRDSNSDLRWGSGNVYGIARQQRRRRPFAKLSGLGPVLSSQGRSMAAQGHQLAPWPRVWVVIPTPGFSVATCMSGSLIMARAYGGPFPQLAGRIQNEYHKGETCHSVSKSLNHQKAGTAGPPDRWLRIAVVPMKE
jgi:hypothetical protein